MRAAAASSATRRGGKRQGAGRKPLGPEPLVRVDVRLLPEEIEYARSRGDGNLSAGVRAIVAAARHSPK